MSGGETPPPAGHNGGPPLDEPAPSVRGRCRTCRQWRALWQAEQTANAFFRLGLSRRRVRRSTGACDRVVLSPGRAPAFSAATAEFGRVNFEPMPDAPRPNGSGFVTLYEAGRIVWQGPEKSVPARFKQEERDLFGPGDP
jgi:hypothetical protein